MQHRSSGDISTNVGSTVSAWLVSDQDDVQDDVQEMYKMTSDINMI